MNLVPAAIKQIIWDEKKKKTLYILISLERHFEFEFQAPNNPNTIINTKQTYFSISMSTTTVIYTLSAM